MPRFGSKRSATIRRRKFFVTAWRRTIWKSQFYAAEALAYLDETSAVGVLAEVARDEPAFRVNALAALSAMDDATAYDALRSLLEVEEC